jgi:hypothetical protein
MSDCDLSLMPSPGSLRDRDNKFYQFLGGGARMKALEAFLDLGLPELLGKEGVEIIFSLPFTTNFLYYRLDYIIKFIIQFISDRSNAIHEIMRKN